MNVDPVATLSCIERDPKKVRERKRKMRNYVPLLNLAAIYPSWPDDRGQLQTTYSIWSSCIDNTYCLYPNNPDTVCKKQVIIDHVGGPVRSCKKAVNLDLLTPGTYLVSNNNIRLASFRACGD